MKKIIAFILIILIIVVGLTIALVHLSMSRSDETIARVDRHIEEVLNR